MASYIKGGMQAKGILKQDPEVNIWVQEGLVWGIVGSEAIDWQVHILNGPLCHERVSEKKL